MNNGCAGAWARRPVSMLWAIVGEREYGVVMVEGLLFSPGDVGYVIG